MKHRRKFELAITDLRCALGDPLMDDRHGALFSATWNLYPFIGEIARDTEKAHILIEVARSAREATGAGRD